MSIKPDSLEIPFSKGSIPVTLLRPEGSGASPLIIISHGTGSSGYVWRDLVTHLAHAGFAVAALEHPHDNRVDNSRADTIENLIDRPRHLRAVIDHLAERSGENVGVVGHSLGAYTALSAAGGLAHTKHQIKYDPLTKIHRSEEIDSGIDERIRALVLLTPAAGWFASPDSLRRVRSETMVLTAEKDMITPSFHAEIIKSQLKVEHREVPNAGHFSFMSPFPKERRSPNFPPGNDPSGYDRATEIQKIYPEISAFFLKSLKNYP